jgi:FkbM family methyltransferase
VFRSLIQFGDGRTATLLASGGSTRRGKYVNGMALSDSLQRSRFWLATRRYYWRQYLFPDEYELKQIHKYIHRDSIAIDVGCNNGIYTYHLSRMAGKVYSFEPNPQYRSRILNLGLRNVLLDVVALSSREGVATLRIPTYGAAGEQTGMASLEDRIVREASSFRAFNVTLRRLDDYALRDVSFMKIDVEGHEEDVIDGGWETIRISRPTLLIEIEERHNPGGLARIVAKLRGLGYEGCYFDRGARKPVECFDPARDQNMALASAWLGRSRRAPRYINNFLFRVGAPAARP